MAILNTGIPTNLTEYPNSFKRQGAFPLESFSVFYSMTEAETYATSNPVAYVGQNIVVVNGNEVDMYLIVSTAGTLKKLASTTASGDLASDVSRLQTEIGNARRGKETLQASIEGMAITVDTTATTEGAAKSYKFSQDGKDIVTIDIPKDMVVSEGTIETYTDENKPEGVEVAGTYVVLTIANKTNDKLYINVSTLLDDKTVEGSTGDMITVTTDTSEGPVKISASIVDASITEAKLATDVTEKLALAVSAVQKIETGATNGTIKVDGVEVSVFGLGDAAYKAVTTEVTEGSDALVTSGAVFTEIGKTNKTVKDHTDDADIHVTTEDKTNWADKYTKDEVDAKIKEHTDDADIHVTTTDKENWADKYTKDEIDTKVKDINDDIKEHTDDTKIHVTEDDKTAWSDKYTKDEIDGKIKDINDDIKEHTDDTDIHVTTEDKAVWADKYTKEEADAKVKAVNDVLEGHVDDTDIHVTTEDKAVWADKYTKTETDNAIATAIANVDHLKREIVTELPTENIDKNTIYMIKKGSSENGDNYEEYMLIDEVLVKIGDTTVDLTDYLTKTGDASDTTVTFTEATEEVPVLTTGDKISVLIGKIKKLFSSLHKVATSGDYNDLSNKIEMYTGTQTTAEKTYTLSEEGGISIYSVELEMDGEKVLGDIVYNENGFTVKFTAAPEKEVKVKALYTK